MSQFPLWFCLIDRLLLIYFLFILQEQTNRYEENHP